MDYKLELIIVPVTDVDRAKAFYSEQTGFAVDVDHRTGQDFRVVQLTPPGSACSITLMRNVERAGSLSGLHLIVEDVQAARVELAGRGIDVEGPFHLDGDGQVPGVDPQRRNYASFLPFRVPDGNHWLVQEVRNRTPGR